MLKWQRLSKEDYALMARSSTWTFKDTCFFMSSFQMEQNCAFGKSKDLIIYRRAVSPDEETELERTFIALREKWADFLLDEIGADRLSYSNVTDRNHPENAPLDGEVNDDLSVLNRDEVLRCIFNATQAGDINLDIEMLKNFLSGNATAPSEASSKKTVSPKVSKKKSNMVDPKSIRGKKGSDEKWKEHNAAKDTIRRYILKEHDAGCTCNHAQLAKHVDEHAADEEGNYLLGSSELSVEVIKETIKELFEVHGIRKVKGTDVYKDETACEVHHPLEYKHQQQKRTS